MQAVRAVRTMRAMKQISVLLADDHPMLMAGVAATLTAKGVNVLDCLTDVRQIVAKYQEYRPDVLVLDIRFGGTLTGFDIAKELRRIEPSARFIFFSQFDEEVIMKEGYQIGASAFLSKDSTPDELLEAIQKTAAGTKFYPPQVAQRLLDFTLHATQRPTDVLDERELRVFILTAQGLILNDVAKEMGLTTRTVSTIMHAIKDKLQIRRPAEFTLLAVKHKLIAP